MNKAKQKAQELRVSMEIGIEERQIVVHCPDEDSEMSIIINEPEGYRAVYTLDLDEAEEIGYFLIEHVKNARESYTKSSSPPKVSAIPSEKEIEKFYEDEIQFYIGYFDDRDAHKEVKEILAKWLLSKIESNVTPPTEKQRACPCLYGNPCDKMCTCVAPFSSRGCKNCCTYGSIEQRTAHANRLLSPPPEGVDVEKLSFERYPKNLTGGIYMDRDWNLNHRNSFFNDVTWAFSQLPQSIESKPKEGWISVEDKMPTFHDGQIIVSNFLEKGNPQRLVTAAVCWDGKFYVLEHWGAEEDNRHEIKGVVYWQPLPEPPEEKKKEEKFPFTCIECGEGFNTSHICKPI